LKESWQGLTPALLHRFYVPVLEGISTVETRDPLSLDLAFLPKRMASGLSPVIPPPDAPSHRTPIGNARRASRP